MNRMRVASVHKIVPISVVAFLLLCTPLQLTAQEARAADQGSTIGWLANLWNDLTAWLTGELAPTPPPHPEQPSESRGENSCAIDPNGGCGG